MSAYFIFVSNYDKLKTVLNDRAVSICKKIFENLVENMEGNTDEIFY
jgi:hypothetical protein